MVRLLKTDQLDENRLAYRRDQSPENVNSFVESILKKTVNFDSEAYEKYKGAWELAILSKNLTDANRQEEKKVKNPQVKCIHHHHEMLKR